jgi:hypothetical protein
MAKQSSFLPLTRVFKHIGDGVFRVGGGIFVAQFQHRGKNKMLFEERCLGLGSAYDRVFAWQQLDSVLGPP